MGSELVSPDPSHAIEAEDPPLSYGEIFERQCAYYLSLGMDLHDYWHGDPALVRYYREKQEIERSRKNQELWLAGLYDYHALMAALSSTFGSSSEGYISEPIPLTKEEAQEREERVARENYLRMHEQMRTMATQRKKD